MNKDIEIPLAPRPPGCAVPLTSVQQVMWGSGTFDARFSTFRMCALSTRVLGSFDIGRMRAAVSAVACRHEALRTRFTQSTEGARQVVDPPGDRAIQIVDVRDLHAADAQRRAEQIAQEFIAANRYLTEGPLFEAQIIKLSNSDHVLLVAVDHMVSDAISCAIVGRELWTLYDNDCGAKTPLPALTVQFPDYAVWQRRVADRWLASHAPYWRARLAGATQLRFPRDSGLAESPQPVVATVFLPLGKKLSEELRAAATRESASLPIVMLGIYAVVLARWCGLDDFVIALTSHGRRGQPQLQNMVGFLAHAPRARIEILGTDTFASVLQRAQLEFTAAHAHQHCGLLPTFVPEFATDAAFNWISSWSRQPAQPAGDCMRRIQPFAIPASSNGAEFCEFSPIFSDSAAGIMVSVRYRPDRFHVETVERFGRNLRAYARAFVQDPYCRLAADYLP